VTAILCWAAKNSLRGTTCFVGIKINIHLVKARSMRAFGSKYRTEYLFQTRISDSCLLLFRRILREENCLGLLLAQLRSPSLTIVSNACGTLWNFSARNKVSAPTKIFVDLIIEVEGCDAGVLVSVDPYHFSKPDNVSWSECACCKIIGQCLRPKPFLYGSISGCVFPL
jgi:hypothetical protein